MLSYLVILLDALFSLSHGKDAVACAVSDHNIGIDVENIVPYNLDVVRGVCSAEEHEMLEQSANKDVDFIKLWTVKEAISKYEGMGLSMPFAGIDISKYSVRTWDYNKLFLSSCADYGVQQCRSIQVISPSII